MITTQLFPNGEFGFLFVDDRRVLINLGFCFCDVFVYTQSVPASCLLVLCYFSVAVGYLAL